MATRYGVEYDLKRSKYVEVVWGFELHFSSIPHLEKFRAGWMKHVDWINDGMSRKFHMETKMDYLALIDFYRRTETRGFYIVNLKNGVEYECAQNLLFHGTKISYQGSTAQLESTTTA